MIRCNRHTPRCAFMEEYKLKWAQRYYSGPARAPQPRSHVLICVGRCGVIQGYSVGIPESELQLENRSQIRRALGPEACGIQSLGVCVL